MAKIRPEEGRMITGLGLYALVAIGFLIGLPEQRKASVVTAVTNALCWPLWLGIWLAENVTSDPPEEK